MPRTIPDKVLEQILGKSTQPRPKGQKGREKQKKTIVKEGRNSPGNYNNPRGGRYMEESAGEQLSFNEPGAPSQPPPTSRGRDIFNERARRGRDLGTFPNKGMGGVVRDTIKGVGEKKFLSMPITDAADIMGISSKGMEAYNGLDDKMKMKFWRAYSEDSKNPKMVLDTLVAGVTGDPNYKVEDDGDDVEPDNDEDD